MWIRHCQKGRRYSTITSFSYCKSKHFLVKWKAIESGELRRNPIENRAISGLSGQNSGTRIIFKYITVILKFS